MTVFFFFFLRNPSELYALCFSELGLDYGSAALPKI